MGLTDSYNNLSEIDRITRRGEQARTKADKLAWAIAKAIGLEERGQRNTVIVGPIKTPERIFKKAIRKGIEVSEVSDVCRVRVIFDDPKQIIELRKLMGRTGGSAPESGFHTKFCRQWNGNIRNYQFLKMDDYFWQPKKHGAIGLDMKVRVPLTNGNTQVVEIQFMHKDMQLTDKTTHAAYEEKQKMEAQARLENRDLNDRELAIIERYEKVAQGLYAADALMYGLDELMHRDHRPPARPQHKETDHQWAYDTIP